MEIRYVDRYTFNNKLGEQFAYDCVNEDLKQIFALRQMQWEGMTTYTNWFYFKDPYPNQELYIQPCIKL